MDNLWLAEPNFLRGYLNKIEGLTTEQINLINDKCPDDNKENSILSINGETAEIKILGVLSPNGPSCIDSFFGFTGTAYTAIIEAVQEAVDDPDVKNIVLKMNTPGGTVDGCDETWQSIKKASSEKNVIAENHGLLASAGYYLASAANEITSFSPSAETGSIGVIYAAYDFTKAYEEMGIKKVVIVSKNAPEKYADISKPKGVDIIQKRINSVERVFILRISQGRGLKQSYIKENFGQGAVLITEDPDKKEPDAISVKMVDKLIEDVSGSNDNSVSDNGANIVGDPGSQQIANNEIDKGAKMGLKALMESDPGLKAEVEAMGTEQFNRGIKSATDRHKANSDKVAKYLAADSTYPNSVKAYGIKVLTGEGTYETFEAIVVAFDATKEQAASAAAADETNVQGDTLPIQTNDSGDGTVANAADVKSAGDELKKLK